MGRPPRYDQKLKFKEAKTIRFLHNTCISLFSGVWLTRKLRFFPKEPTRHVLSSVHSSSPRVTTVCIYSVIRRSVRLRILVTDVHKPVIAHHPWLVDLFGRLIQSVRRNSCYLNSSCNVYVLYYIMKVNRETIKMFSFQKMVKRMVEYSPSKSYIFSTFPSSYPFRLCFKLHR